MDSNLSLTHAGRHIPSLDGVRGIAILLVMFCHSVLYGGMEADLTLDTILQQLGSFGWMGVDLFFVLSGFLITGILLDSRRSATYFASFFMRRVLRIFPLYFVTLALFTWIMPLFPSLGPRFVLAAPEQFWYWTYLTNIRIALEGWPKQPVLGHFWSLAVEEQFYLVWPFVVYAFRRETLSRICLACIILPLLIRIVLVLNAESTAAHVLTITRLDALAMGGLLAIEIRKPAADQGILRYRKPVLIGCILLLPTMYINSGALWLGFPIVTTLDLSIIALGSVSLLATLLLEQGHRRLSRVLEFAPLRFLGKYSYGIYVIHHPVIIYLGKSQFAAAQLPRFHDTQFVGQIFVFVACVVISIALALVSWALLERPFLRLKRLFPYDAAVKAV